MGNSYTYNVFGTHTDDIVEPGRAVNLVVDQTMIHDVTGCAAISVAKDLLRRMGKEKIKNPDSVVIISDHYVVTKDPSAIRNHDILRKFAEEQGIEHAFLTAQGYDGDYAKVGKEYFGVCHQLMPDKGLFLPGMTLFGADSHTCTAGGFGMLGIGVGSTDAGISMVTNMGLQEVPKVMNIRFEGILPPHLMAKDMILAVLQKIGREGGAGYIAEFTGDTIKNLTPMEKLTLCNMTTEGNFLTGIIQPTHSLMHYLIPVARRPFQEIYTDKDAEYHKTITFDTQSLDALVALPHSPDNVRPAKELGGIPVQRVYVGSCTGGKYDDMYAFASVVKGHKLKTEVFVIPATMAVAEYIRQERIDGQTLDAIFREAGAYNATGGEMGPVGCNACLGGPSDTVGYVKEPINVVSTTNRNFEGRMGSKKAKIYLASPLTAAATAIAGEITDPKEFV